MGKRKIDGIEKVFFEFEDNFAARVKDAENNLYLMKICKNNKNILNNKSKINSEYELFKKFGIKEILRPVDIIKYNDEEGILFENEKGIFLNEYLNRKPMDIQEFLKISILICDGLINLQKKEIIHGNINPYNIIINEEDNRVKFWSIRADLNTFICNSPILCQYMSPEKINKRNMTHNSDYYSLGIIFYEMLSGKTPFYNKDITKIIYCHLSRKPYPISELNQRIPKVLSKIVSKLLNKNPASRYKSAFGIKKDLEECNRYYEKFMDIPDFNMPIYDVNDQVYLSKKIYGRQKELDELEYHFSENVKEKNNVIFLTGDMGAGKTALINKFIKKIKENKVIVINIDGKTVSNNNLSIQILNELAIHVIMEENIDFQKLKDDIRFIIKGCEELIFNFSPLLKNIFDYKPDIQYYKQDFNYNTFIDICNKLIVLLKECGNRLLIKINNIDLEDINTLKLLTKLLCDYEIKKSMILIESKNKKLINKDQENIINTIENKKICDYYFLNISNLKLEEIQMYLKDTFYVSNEIAITLSYVIFNKTQGNPFLIEQLIFKSIENKQIYFNKNKWKWDLKSIGKNIYNKNIKDYINNVIYNMDKERLDIVYIIHKSIYGLTKEEIKKIMDIDEEKLENIVSYLIYNNFISQIEKLVINKENYIEKIILYRSSNDFMENYLDELDGIEGNDNKHILEKILRIKIDKLSLEMTACDYFEFESLIKLIDICKYNLKENEKVKITQVYTYIGEQAMISQNYEEAELLFGKAYEIYKEELSEKNYGIYFRLNKYKAAVLATRGNIVESEKILKKLMNNTEIRTSLVLYTIRINNYLNNSKYAEACIISKQCLRYISMNSLVIKSKLFYYINLKKIKFVVQENMLEDVFTEFMIKSIIVAMYVDKEYFIKLVELAYYYDLDLYLNKFFIRKSRIELDIKARKAMDKVVRDTLEYKYNISPINYVICEMLPWYYSYNNVLQYCTILNTQINNKNIYERDCNNIFMSLILLFKGADIREISNKISYMSISSVKGKDRQLLKEFKVLSDVIDIVSNNKTSLIKMEYTELYRESKKQGHLVLSSIEYLIKFLFKQYDNTLEEVLEDNIAIKQGVNAFTPEYYFYSCVCLFDVYNQNNTKAKKKIKMLIKECFNEMNIYNKSCSENYRGKFLIVKAICLNLEGKFQESLKIFEESIEDSKKQRNKLIEAIAEEIIFIICNKNKFTDMGRVYLMNSINSYEKWGGVNKVNQLCVSNRYLITNNEFKFSVEMSDRIEQIKSIEMDSVIKILQTISREMDMNTLLEKLISITIENTKTERAIILLDYNENLIVKVEGNKNSISIKNTPFKDYNNISRNIVFYVIKMKEKIVVNDAITDERFMLDKYIRSNKVKSVACYPIIMQGKCIGVIYLENSCITEAFNREGIDILEYIAIQSGIAISNAKMYEELEHSNAMLENIIEGKTMELKKSIEKLTLEIKEREVMDNRLRESEKKYKTVFYSIPELAYLYDFKQECVIDSNSSFKDMIGAINSISKNETVKFLTLDGKEFVLHNIINDVLKGKVIEDVKVKVIKSGNILMYLNQTYIPIYEDNEINRMICLAKDITDSIEIENTRKIVVEKDELLIKALEYDKMKTEFFANLSHEFKTPLNVILGSIQLLNKIPDENFKNDNIKATNYLSMMKQNCYRLLRLVNNLIDITRLEDGYLKLTLNKYNIVSVVEDITMSVAQYASNKNINVIFDTDIEEKEIIFDEEKLERILLNILSNALKFTNEEGNIEVTVTDGEKCIIISIKDDGIGIPEEKLVGIFNRFEQVDKSLSRNHEGSGIGLSLTKMLVELHGGNIKAISEYGKGSEFIIEIPCDLNGNCQENREEEIVAVKQDKTVEKINIEFSDIYF